MDAAISRRSTRRGPRRPRGSLVGLVRGELLKLSRQVSIWVALGLFAAAFLVVVVVGGAGQARVRVGFQQSPEDWMRGVLPGVQMLFQFCSGVVLLAVSARLMGSEYSAGTLRVLLARGSGRLRLLGAKIAALLLFAAGVLALYSLLTAAYFVAVAVAAGGSLDAFRGLSPRLWQDLGLIAVAEVASMVACVMVGVTAAVVGRSLAFAIGVAMAFFAADSVYTEWAPLLVQLTHQEVMADATGYLLGPNLNALAQHLRTGPPSAVPGPGPVGGVDTAHAAIVVVAWIAGMAVVSAGLLWRRDVLE
jgi:ABC-2 type transport system permease protein